MNKAKSYGCEDMLIEEMRCELGMQNCNLNIDGEFLKELDVESFQIEKFPHSFYTFH